MSSDDFAIDDLFNFPNDDIFVGELHEEEEIHGKKHDEDIGLCSVSTETGFLPPEKTSMEISFPADDDLADLEWLSQIVDDSFDLPEQSTALPHKPTSHTYENWSKPEVYGSSRLCFNTPVPGKPWSKKRARTGGRVCSFPLGLESDRFRTNRPMKKQKRKMARTEEYAWSGSISPPVRRCSHCGAHKTPQWRAGPMGAKSLCNACGVRFKSGRMFPEYRPACSPTFCSELHSNHHRKVLEMRQHKEISSRAEASGS